MQSGLDPDWNDPENLAQPDLCVTQISTPFVKLKTKLSQELPVRYRTSFG